MKCNKSHHWITTLKITLKITSKMRLTPSLHTWKIKLKELKKITIK